VEPDPSALPAPTAQGLSICDYDTAIHEMLDIWRAMRDEGMTAKTEQSQTALIRVSGLTAHIGDLSIAFAILREGSSPIASIGAVRSALECAMTARWIATVPGAEVAFARESARQFQMATGVEQALIPWPEELSLTSEQTLRLTREARVREVQFKAAFPNASGAIAYGDYRRACALTHPSDVLLTAYLHMEDGHAFILPRGRVPLETRWTALMARTLLVALDTISDMSAEGTHSAALDELDRRTDGADPAGSQHWE
jgi:hypothetical protein